MSFYWIYDLPNWLMGLLTIAAFNVVALGGMVVTMPLVKRLLKGSAQHNDIVSFFFAGIGVFYGLAMGLIAVGTWENFNGVDAIVGKEAAALAALYRDLDSYPAETRGRLESALRDYTKFVVQTEWPAHRKGEAPEEGTHRLDRIENDIMAFDPSGERQKINHTEVIHTLGEVVELRRMRLMAVGTGLPMSLWSVVLFGALLNFVIGYLFWVENRALHAVLMSLLATFIGLLVFLTAAMDNPFRGEFSVTSDPIQTVLESVMKPSDG